MIYIDITGKQEKPYYSVYIDLLKSGICILSEKRRYANLLY